MLWMAQGSRQHSCTAPTATAMLRTPNGWCICSFPISPASRTSWLYVLPLAGCTPVSTNSMYTFLLYLLQACPCTPLLLLLLLLQVCLRPCPERQTISGTGWNSWSSCSRRCCCRTRCTTKSGSNAATAAVPRSTAATSREGGSPARGLLAAAFAQQHVAEAVQLARSSAAAAGCSG